MHSLKGVLLLWLSVLFLTHCNELDKPKVLNAYTKSIRKRFENAFFDKCPKYPFVKQWEKQLENTGDRYVTFIYHEPGLRNGGLGDRLSGLVNAIALSLRFNRTLLIESQNNFHDLFRPYHPTVMANGEEDISKASTDYNYTWKKENWTTWSKWDRKYVDNDATEYDMWWCVNCVAWRNPLCGMDDGDAAHPHIKIRGNRNYLCKWATHKDIKAHQGFLDVIAPDGVTSYEEINLMEVAGCMMRLAMWPTEELWQYVSDSMESLLGHEEVQKPNSLQVGAHFRCGDAPSYLSKDHNQCVHDVDGTNPHTESPYMGTGSPDVIGKCVGDIIQKPEPFEEAHVSQDKVDAIIAEKHGDSQKIRKKNKKRRHLLRGSQPHHRHHNTINDIHHEYFQHRQLYGEKDASRLVYIASDNAGASQQINTTANHPLTVISPSGCHVELDPSFDCSQLTIGYWLILASSDAIVTQTDHTGSPISAFSRFAGVYGLRGDSYRDAHNCTDVKAMYDISRRWTGNWFCD